MSDINKEYGKEIRRFEFDGSHPGQKCGSVL